MPYTLTCPVCERPGVPVNSASCPQCDADLTCFQALESLAEKKFPVPVPVKVPQKKKNPFLSPPVLFLCLLLIFVGGYFCFYALRAQDHVNELEQQVVALQTNLQVAEREVAQTKKMVSVIPESEQTFDQTSEQTSEQIKVAQENPGDTEDTDTDSDTFAEESLLVSVEDDIQLGQAQATQDAAKDRKEKQGTQNRQDVTQDTKRVAHVEPHVAQTEHPGNTKHAEDIRDILPAQYTERTEHTGNREDIQATASSATVEEDNKEEVVMVASVVEKPQAVATTPGPATEQTGTTTEQELHKEGQAKGQEGQDLAEQEIIHKIVHKIYRGKKKAELQTGNDVKTLPVNVPVIEMVSKKKKPPLPAVLSAVSKTAQVEQTVKESVKESAGESLPVLPEKRWSKKTFLYLAKKTDTLWDLAKHFYGDGKYYPVIMELNPDLAFSHIEDDKSVRFFSDRAVLQDMYNHRIEWRQGMMLWKHKVLAGETQQVIERRFASPRSLGRVLYDKNPLMYPGALIRIILQ
ncbi:MAG: hypothetical protein D3915_13165 [Candidatus Electrothrix sp. AU1_5]|nr:hypothetical protein [Candidatus Electrothrix gigas]